MNGKMTQAGNTRDLIYDIPYLIEYMSSFMTLSPGDVILTGTPEGVVNVVPGDVVACEIDGLGNCSTPSPQTTSLPLRKILENSTSDRRRGADQRRILRVRGIPPRRRFSPRSRAVAQPK